MANFSSSSSSPSKYDVFLSFRGTDTRKIFVGILHKELERRCIKTFKDDKELEKGSTISPELVQAIEGSRFAIAIVSENYASSSWCLEELAKIMECEEKKSLTAIPIFYEVDPSDVRWQKGKFAEHFEKHEKRENPEQVKRWRDALTKLANKSGMDSRNWGDDAELIDEITKDILNQLNFAASSDFTDLVGMDVHMEAMYRLLDLESNNEVHLIGIWGMGGVGKTTLARYVYENIVQNFQTCCFLDDVKKIYHDHGASGLQRELVSKIQGEALRNSYLGSNVINERLRRRKVLLVVDDVDDVDQLDALAKEDRWFGPGSRVIVTTRDKNLLHLCGIKHVYEAKCLTDNKALQLFCQLAFKQKHPLNGFQSLSERAVRIAGGLPLALRVFGSFLFGRSEGFWEDAFYELETSLDVEKVTKVLKISYDGLREGDKYIFLYVAGFFDGKGHVSDVVYELDKGVRSGIEVLAEKCLISISGSGDISMHDLIKQMGRELVRQQSPHNPGKRLILWKRDEIYKVLSNKQESETVEAISLDMDEGNKLIVGKKAFEKVPNLRCLRICSSSIDGETKLQHPQGIRINFLDQLRYLSWLNCPSNIFQFRANNLVKLEFRFGKFEKLWEDPPCLENLKEIDVSGSKNLKEFPDLSKAPNLQVIRAKKCTSLTEIPPSICSLEKLTQLDLGLCKGLQRVPNKLDMKSLEDVDLDYCPPLKMYPESCRGVKRLILDVERVSELPESIGRLSYLKYLQIENSERLNRIPDTIGDLISLKSLMLVNCPMLQSIPESIGRLSNLEDLHLANCERLKHLSDTIGDLIALKSLKLWHCTMLQGIPESIGRLSNLEDLHLANCERLKHLSDTIGDLIALKSLKLWHCPMLQSIPETIWKLKSLETFEFHNHPFEHICSRFCPSLKMYPVNDLILGMTRDNELRESIGHLSYLEHLELRYWRLKQLPDTIGDLISLKSIELGNCPMLQSIPESIGRLSYLKTLEIKLCERLKHLPDTIGDLISLKCLRLENCHMLRSIPESIGRLSCLETLEIELCERLKHLPDTIGDLISLKCLSLENCRMLRNIPETIWKLKSLESFVVFDGRDITEFPNLPETIRSVSFIGTMIEEIPSSIGDLHLLKHLDISGSERLKNLSGSIYELKCLKRLFLRDCPCLESFTSQICGTESYFEEHDVEETSSRTLLLPNLEELIISQPKKSDGLSFHCPSFSNFPSLRILRLIDLSMVEIFGDLGLLTDLEVLDLRGNDFGMIPVSIKGLTKLSELRIDDCVNLYSLPELPPNVEVLSIDGCAALVEVSEIFKLNFTNKILRFANCFKLKGEIQLFSGLMASMVGDEALVVLPGSEVPSCFDHRSKGSSLTVSLPFGSSSIEHMRFVGCVVPSDHVDDGYFVEWKCQYTFDELSLSREARVSLGHMLFFNGDLRLSEDKEVVFDQISFEFSFKPSPRKNNEPLPKIKECGVYLEYTPSSSSFSSSATCDVKGTSGPSPSTKKQKSFHVFRVVLFLFLISFLLSLFYLLCC